MKAIFLLIVTLVIFVTCSEECDRRKNNREREIRALEQMAQKNCQNQTPTDTLLYIQ